MRCKRLPSDHVDAPFSSIIASWASASCSMAAISRVFFTRASATWRWGRSSILQSTSGARPPRASAPRRRPSLRSARAAAECSSPSVTRARVRARAAPSLPRDPPARGRQAQAHRAFRLAGAPRLRSMSGRPDDFWRRKPPPRTLRLLCDRLSAAVPTAFSSARATSCKRPCAPVPPPSSS
jgi:hypothetical protein